MVRRHALPAMLAAFVSAIMLPGCSVYQYAKLSSWAEPHIYHRDKDSKISLATYRAMADRAWAESGAECPSDCNYTDFGLGFREGFAQYVYAGGDGKPPALPPRVYWQLDMRTAEGSAAVRSWFEGYRIGAEVARAGGYREVATVTVSASLRDCTPCGCPDSHAGASCPSGDCQVEPIIQMAPALETPAGIEPIETPQSLPTPVEENSEPILLPPVAQPQSARAKQRGTGSSQTIGNAAAVLAVSTLSNRRVATDKPRAQQANSTHVEELPLKQPVERRSACRKSTRESAVRKAALSKGSGKWSPNQPSQPQNPGFTG